MIHRGLYIKTKNTTDKELGIPVNNPEAKTRLIGKV
jgi:hypothetical protein